MKIKLKTGITRKLKKTTRVLLRMAYIICILGVVFLGIYSSLGRYYIPRVEQNQQYLIGKIQEYSKEPINIKGLSGSWSGLTPIISFKEVSFARDFGSFKTGRLEVEVDIFRSLLQQKIVFKNLHFNNAYIEINNSDDLLAGDKKSSKFSFVPEEFIKIIEGFSSASIDNASVKLLFKDGTYTEINNISMVIQKKIDSQFVTIEADFANSGKIQGKLELNSVLHTSANRASGWLKVNGGELSVFEPITNQLGFLSLPDSPEGEFWIDWRKNYYFKAQGNLHIPTLELPTVGDDKLKNITNIKSRFYFSLLNGGDPKLWIKKANFNWYGAEQAFNQFYIQMDDLFSPNKASIYFPSFSIDYLTQLSAEYPLPDKLKSIAADLAPQGHLKDLHIDIDFFNKDEPVVVRANLENASVKPWKGAPGVTGVNGYVEAKKQTGFIELDTRNISLDFPSLYKEPLFFQKAKTRVHWKITDTRVSVFSDLIQASGDFGSAQGQLALDLPITHDSYEPTMYLAIGFNNIDAKYRMRYIPVIIDEGLYDWVKTSVKNGKVKKGGFIYRGSIEPDHAGYQTFQFFADVTKAGLDYQPPWPEVSGVSGKLVINDTTVKVKATEGTVYKSKIKNSVIEVAKNNDIIELTGFGSGDFLSLDVIRLLQESPIADMTNNAFNNWYAKGKATAGFSLYIPFTKKIAPEVYVAAEVKNTQLTLPVNDLVIDDINGAISYSTKKGLSGENIQGEMFGHKLDVDILAEDKYGRQTQVVSFFGKASIDELNAWLDQPIFEFMSGKTAFSGKVLIDNAVTLQTAFDMQGVSIKLPEPLGKSKNELWNVNANAIVKDGSVFFKLQEDNAFSLALNWTDGLLSQGDIFLGKQQVNNNTANAPQTITLSGALSNGQLDDWMSLINRYSDYYSKPVTATSTSDESSTSNFIIKDLKINHAKAFSLLVDDLSISMQDSSAAWQVYLNSPAVQGSVLLMKDKNLATVVDLSYLSLQLPFIHQPTPAVEATNGQGVNPTPIVLPFIALQQNKEVDTDFSEKLNVHVNRLMLNGIDAGDWSMSVKPSTTAVRVEGIKVKSLYADISGVEGSGAVLTWPKNAKNASSSFDGVIQVKSLKRFLNKWGYDAPLDAESGAFSINLSWPGVVQDIALSTLNGTVSLNIAKGGFRSLNSSGANFLKTIGVFNVSEVFRRLRFDFSDVTDKGFSFDEVTGVLLFQNGNLSMSRPLYVLSPSSELRFSGETNLLTRTLNMSVVATLPINNNLPWIAALAGGLPVAAGVFVVSKVMEKQVNQLSSAVYDITGTWDDPKVVFNRLFDPGKSTKPSTPESNTVKKAGKK